MDRSTPRVLKKDLEFYQLCSEINNKKGELDHSSSCISYILGIHDIVQHLAELWRIAEHDACRRRYYETFNRTARNFSKINCRDALDKYLYDLNREILDLGGPKSEPPIGYYLPIVRAVIDVMKATPAQKRRLTNLEKKCLSLR